MKEEAVRFVVGERVGEVSALSLVPPEARHMLVLAHGAGAGMAHPFMESTARALAELGVATFRYQFPYTEAGRRRPDPPGILTAAVRAAFTTAAEAFPKFRLFAGGKSMGGRMTSQAAAKQWLPDARGLVFLGFPLHAPGRPGTDRAEHLKDVQVPMLFLQGTRDSFADLSLLRSLCEGLGDVAQLHVVEDADHSFHVRKSSGRTDGEVLGELADRTAEFMENTTV